jgi:DNA-binding NarL/FixJ family response regulator
MDKCVRVFLIDDDEAFRVSAGRFLRRHASCELVGLAAWGEEALQGVAALGPDLVLVDTALPGVSGLEVTLRLKDLAAPPRVAVVTTHEGGSYCEAESKAGADGLIPKSDFTLQVMTLLHKIAENRGVADREKCGRASTPRRRWLSRLTFSRG